MDRFHHADGTKSKDVELKGKKLQNKGVSVDPMTKAGEGMATPPAKAPVKAGSYNKKKRKSYEEMLEEAGRI